MTTTKTTPAMLNALRRISVEPKSITTPRLVRADTASKLRDAGLIEYFKVSGDLNFWVRITDAGRTALG